MGTLRFAHPDETISRFHAYAHTLTPLLFAIAVPLLGVTNRESGANHAMGPLEGIKVIDMTTVLMGPYATQMLGDYGADVIKIETPDGDVTRQIGPTRHPGMGPVFLNTNRSKRSICLDLKKPAGRDAVLRLIATADVLVYNVRPQAMARLQLGYDVVCEGQSAADLCRRVRLRPGRALCGKARL